MPKSATTNIQEENCINIYSDRFLINKFLICHESWAKEFFDLSVKQVYEICDRFDV
jgi:hypothetical protein